MFKGVLPGSYQVQASHKSYKFDKVTALQSKLY